MQTAPQVPMTAQHLMYANGLRGVAQTIAVMRHFVQAARVDPLIRNAATSIIFLQPEKDEMAEVVALFEYVRDRIRYTRDVYDVETLSTPLQTLHARIGDCDDQSALLASLCEAVGYPTRFIVAGYSDPKAVEHVYMQVHAADNWFDCDPTEQHAFGWCPPGAVSLYIEGV